jgi:hypothetical protein
MYCDLLSVIYNSSILFVLETPDDGSVTDVKNGCSYTSTVPYVSVVWYLVKLRDSFIFIYFTKSGHALISALIGISYSKLQL